MDSEAPYLAALSDYFTAHPYSAWFDFYQKTLTGLDTSYYPTVENSALH